MLTHPRQVVVVVEVVAVENEDRSTDHGGRDPQRVGGPAGVLLLDGDEADSRVTRSEVIEDPLLLIPDDQYRGIHDSAQLVEYALGERATPKRQEGFRKVGGQRPRPL